MAAKTAFATYTGGAATKISDGAVSNACVVAEKDVYLIATEADSEPSDLTTAFPLRAFSTITADLDLASIFPGLTAPYYLWVWPTAGATEVFISHAGE